MDKIILLLIMIIAVKTVDKRLSNKSDSVRESAMLLVGTFFLGLIIMTFKAPNIPFFQAIIGTVKTYLILGLVIADLLFFYKKFTQ